MATIIEDYVSFEIAKLLKEKGFDARCKYVWKLDKANDPQDNDGISKICAERFMEGESFVDNSDIKKVSEYEDWFEDYHKAYLCPTIQMALKWLREVHNVHIVIYPYTEKEGHNWSFIFDKFAYGCWQELGIYITDSWNTYEEAAEVAIKYCLGNLI